MNACEWKTPPLDLGHSAGVEHCDNSNNMTFHRLLLQQELMILTSTTNRYLKYHLTRHT